MIIKRFVGANAREAMRELRDTLGDNALILSNRPIEGGVEIMAVAENEMSEIAGTDQPVNPAMQSILNNAVKSAYQNTAKIYDDGFDDTPKVSLSSVGGGATPSVNHQLPIANATSAPRLTEPDQQLSSLSQRAQSEVKKYQQPPANNIPQPQPAPNIISSRSPAPASRLSGSVSSSSSSSSSSSAGEMKQLVREVKILRSMLEGQLAGLAWSDMKQRDPVKVELMRHLLAVGYSPLLSRQLVNALPANLDTVKAMRWTKTVIAKNIKTITQEEELIEKGGIFALVGPTGIGKTTTIAKLAARYTLKHGAYNLALLTTDSYRIGAHDQLRIYGRILGVPVYTIRDQADLDNTINELKDKHLLLIDTVGMSQRDERVSEQLNLLANSANQSIKRLLLLNSTVQGNTLEDTIKTYQKTKLDGCVLTKVDESLGVASALDVIIRYKLPIHYVTNGQRVPEDLHLANSLYLTDRSLRLNTESNAFALQEQEYALSMANSMSGEQQKNASPLDVFVDHNPHREEPLGEK